MSSVGGLNIANIGANNTQEVTVGPFEWTPNINAYGHDCVLMMASTAGDPRNVDNFTGTESIAEGGLVPNDKNVRQRRVSEGARGGGLQSRAGGRGGALAAAGTASSRR